MSDGKVLPGKDDPSVLINNTATRSEVRVDPQTRRVVTIQVLLFLNCLQLYTHTDREMLNKPLLSGAGEDSVHQHLQGDGSFSIDT